MKDLVWTGVIPFLDESPGVGFFFKWMDIDYRVECWYTQHSSGTDFYREGSGECVTGSMGFMDSEQFTAELEKITQVWHTKYQDWVSPALDKAHIATLVAMQSRPDTGSSASVQSYIETGRYLQIGETP